VTLINWFQHIWVMTVQTNKGVEFKVCAAKRAPWAIDSDNKELKWAWIAIDPQENGNDISGLCRTKDEAEKKAKATAKRIETILSGQLKCRTGIQIQRK